MASWGNSSRNLNKEKGPMHNLLEHVGGDVNYDRSYHEFLQDQFGSDHPSSPNPPLIIPEFDGLNHDPNTPNTNENLSNPPPLQMIFLQCNYCSKSYKTAKSFGYGTYWAHIKRSHPSEFEKSNNQAQIARYATSGLEIDVLHYCDSVKNLLYELYDEYLRMYGPSLNLPVSQPPPTSGGTSTSTKFQLKGLEDRLFSQRAKKLRTSSSSSVSELDRYLEDTHEFLEEKFSLQVWWKTHQLDYPILAIIAKQILGTSVSTLAVEQEFSAGGNILEPRRSVMSPQSLEMQACVDDWTKAKYRQQELQPEIVNDFFEYDQTTGTEGSD
ncbi:hypothetical protein LWI28_025182 [Acer negundo]|uniref:HAT C-terminal dimerisation domain-containing protein n=1 Tax=Acer negundo TaxID=4023 RepID=A0AAD5INW9_ACENE|nr:hypothetical protein LWI28_025182 [Acer negundo]